MPSSCVPRLQMRHILRPAPCARRAATRHHRLGEEERRRPAGRSTTFQRRTSIPSAPPFFLFCSCLCSSCKHQKNRRVKGNQQYQLQTTIHEAPSRISFNRASATLHASYPHTSARISSAVQLVRRPSQIPRKHHPQRMKRPCFSGMLACSIDSRATSSARAFLTSWKTRSRPSTSSGRVPAGRRKASAPTSSRPMAKPCPSATSLLSGAQKGLYG